VVLVNLDSLKSGILTALVVGGHLQIFNCTYWFKPGIFFSTIVALLIHPAAREWYY
jgi:hypothetical protein